MDIWLYPPELSIRSLRAILGAMSSDVVINARAAMRPELGGVERWARELAVRLPGLRPGRYGVARPPRRFVHRAGHLWEQAVLPLYRCELLLSPANVAPLASRRSVVVIHDVAPLRDPSWYSPAYVRWQRFLLPRLADRALRIITPSAFSAAEIETLLGVASERIAVIPGGHDERFNPAQSPESARNRFGLADAPYVLTVGSQTARKNVRALTETARRLAASGISLIAVGGDRPQFRDASGDAGIRQLGPVEDELLPALYAGAAAFVLPSLYEGFGLTALEAMACGTPVVASSAGALPEVCGDAAQLVDPRDQGAIASAVENAIADPGRWRQAGPRRAAGFTWEATAAAVDAELAALLDWPT